MSGVQIIAKAKSEGRSVLTELESKEILKEAGIPVVETRLATTQEEAVTVSQKMGFPVALKVASPEIPHKSDAGGVRLGLASPGQVALAYEEIMAAVREHYPVAPVQGVAVQKMARPGTEIIVGASQNPQFGPVLMFGLGGIFVEALKDVSFRIVPLTGRDAAEMIREIKGYVLLHGYRGQEPVDITSLEKLLLKVSGFVEQNPQVKELDLNPVFAYRDGALAVDARIILR